MGLPGSPKKGERFAHGSGIMEEELDALDEEKLLELEDEALVVTLDELVEVLLNTELAKDTRGGSCVECRSVGCSVALSGSNC